MTGVSRHDFVEVTFLLRKVRMLMRGEMGKGRRSSLSVIVSTVGLDAP